MSKEENTAVFQEEITFLRKKQAKASQVNLLFESFFIGEPSIERVIPGIDLQGTDEEGLVQPLEFEDPAYLKASSILKSDLKPQIGDPGDQTTFLVVDVLQLGIGEEFANPGNAFRTWLPTTSPCFV